MIRIERTSCPDCLKDVASDGNAYTRGEVAEALWKMQHGKCCYSEVQIPKKGHGKHIEHWKPQSAFSWLRNEWTNLLLACPQCNGSKSDQYPIVLTEKNDDGQILYLNHRSGGTAIIIDPSAPGLNPERELTYVLDDRDPLYGQVTAREGSVLGRATIEITGIADSHFLRLRKDRLLTVLDATYRNILLAANNSNEDACDAALETFRGYLSPKSVFAGLAREFAREKKLDVHFNLQIPDA